MTLNTVSGADLDDPFEALLGPSVEPQVLPALCTQCAKGGNHLVVITLQDGPTRVSVESCMESRRRQVFCRCHDDILKTEMVPMPFAGFSEDVNNVLTCPLCKWTLTFELP